ncbi:M20/M25/M40 family metallo-hydrolase [Halomicroarcula sp. F13]|uniref:M20/M25/M40 family metallo-hydrolase n=1 Tax=Haloarcula rubra TaxID=2487747 RepID=A0AAW4PNK7_9EURY|nr:M20/M25/M40 family metallo-hydrolase [Halomicroarcula rubra]MBX0322170.1 M20/M25/M40 family metallo-hydrolase [Halomicroarcula rubra]
MHVADLTEELVAIPSHEDESAAGEFVASWLRDHTDATVEHDAHGNVVARKGSGDGDSLALVGHHDVVPPDESQVDADGGYVVERSDGRIYGRGSADMKGSVAAAMLAFEAADTPAEDELVFVSFAGEEQGGVGCRAAIEDGFSVDYAVVGEGSTGYSAPGITDVAVAHKGRRGSTIVAEGAAAHASEPEAGANAIYRATEAVDVVRGLEFPSTGVLGHEVRGSVAVTEIDGGSAWNVIPEQCEATVDERTVPGERAPLDRVEDTEGVSWRVDQDLPPMACGDADFADAVLDSATDAQDGAPEHVVKPHATDAGWLAAEGTDCVVVGAAEPGEAHTADESVSVDVLERCQRIYEGVAASWVR